MRVRTHTNPLNFYQRMEMLSLEKLFKNSEAPLDMEIGFGRGVFLREWAKLHPERNIIGVEVRKTIVTILEERLKALNIKNTHLIHGNGEIVLKDCIQDGSLSRCFIFHPDPWFKKRHYKRRVINEKLLTLLSTKLKENGKIYISTDVGILFEDICEHFSKFTEFKLVENDSFWTSDYKTHWSDFSKTDNRDLYYLTFQKTTTQD